MRPVCSMVLLAASTPTKRAERLRRPGPARMASRRLPAAARAMRVVRDRLRALRCAPAAGRCPGSGTGPWEWRCTAARSAPAWPAPPAASSPGASSTQVSAAVVVARSRRSKKRLRCVRADAAAAARRRGGFSQRADIIGTSVSDTTAEIRMVMASVTANSRNSRPTTSPMNSSGISTAISDTVSEMMVKPICARALERGRHRRFALLDVARDVLDHHDGVVDHEAGGDGQRHQDRLFRL